VLKKELAWKDEIRDDKIRPLVPLAFILAGVAEWVDARDLKFSGKKKRAFYAKLIFASKLLNIKEVTGKEWSFVLSALFALLDANRCHTR
jgi:hypothetical protein